MSNIKELGEIVLEAYKLSQLAAESAVYAAKLADAAYEAEDVAYANAERAYKLTEAAIVTYNDFIERENKS